MEKESMFLGMGPFDRVSLQIRRLYQDDSGGKQSTPLAENSLGLLKSDRHSDSISSNRHAYGECRGWVCEGLLSQNCMSP